jgi:hypothetical protein
MMMAQRTTWVAWATGALLLIAMTWPALYNGQPIFFADTTAYIRGADAGFQAALHRKSVWSLQQESVDSQTSASTPAVEAPSALQAPSTRSLSSIKDKTVLTGRSVYYGALLYLGDLTSGFWLTVALQSAAVLGTLLLLVRPAGLAQWPTLPLLGACLVLGTTAPFFVSFLMPDVFAGVAVLVAATLLAEQEPGRWEGYHWGALVLLATSAVVHDSHFLIIAALLAVAAVWNLARRSWTNWRGMAVLGVTLVIALLAQSLFGAVVKHVVGAPPLRPPFLTARLVEDGPGYRYLRATCPGNGFKVCAFLDRLPLQSDIFLWDADQGVFAGADPQLRRELSEEQTRFTLAVLAYDPGALLLTSLENAASQLVMVGLPEFSYEDWQRKGFASKVPPKYFEPMQKTAAYRQAMPVAQLSVLLLVVLVAGAGLVAAGLAWPAARARLPAPLVRLSSWTLAGVLINAAACGILSGPHARYAARVDWALPLVAVMIAAVVLKSRREEAAVAEPRATSEAA